MKSYTNSATFETRNDIFAKLLIACLYQYEINKRKHCETMRKEFEEQIGRENRASTTEEDEDV